MKINQNRPDTKQVPVNVINTLVEQISDLQTDVATLQSDVEGLEQSVDTVNIEATEAQINRINATNISSTNATINTITASNKVDTAKLDANQAEVDTATIGTETVSSSTITDATIATANITDLDAVNGTVQHLSAGDIEATSVEADAVITESITNSGNYTGKNVSVENVTASDTVTTKDLNVTDTANIKDLNISGQITGISSFEASQIATDEIEASNGKIIKLSNTGTFLNSEQTPLTPTPSLDNTDTYTIELPTFTGRMILVWKDGNFIKWKAYVTSNGNDYNFSWSTPDGNNYVQKLFNWNKHLYIRHNANGQLFYSYSTDHELSTAINIYYNMQGWSYPQSLEELCDEHYEIDLIRPSGTVQFGAVGIPMLEGGGSNSGTLAFKGSCTFNNLPNFSNVMAGDVWNITDEAYTDSRFVEGAGKPINAGDDVVAVIVDYGDGKIEEIDEDTFSRKEVRILCKTINGKFIISVYDSMQSEISSYIGVPGNWRKIEYDAESELGSWADAAICLPNGRLLVGSGSGIYYSDDEGVTWTESDFGYPDDTLNAQFTYDVEHNKLFYQDNHEDGYSYDGGEHWTWYEDGEAPGYLSYIKGQLADYPRGESSGDIYGSTDGAETFNKIGETPDWGEGLGVVNTDNGTLLFLAREREPESQYYHYKHAIFKSTDLGATWERTWISDSYEYANYSIIPVIGSDTIIISKTTLGQINTYNTYSSIDFGATQSDFAAININNAARFSEDEILSTVAYPQAEAGVYLIDSRRGVQLMWDKFSAGVNYENFTAQNINVTTSLKLNGNDVLTTANRGVSNGVATLDATGRVPYSQLPESAMEYKGTWDASTNTPSLADGTGTNGDFYVVSVAGTVTFSAGRSITFYVNDRVIYDGTLHEWERLPAGEVRTVNGMSGDVVLTANDIGAATGSDITSALSDLDVSSIGGAGKYISVVSQTNGKLAAVAISLATTITSGVNVPVTSGAVYDYVNTAITQVLNTGF